MQRKLFLTAFFLAIFVGQNLAQAQTGETKFDVPAMIEVNAIYNDCILSDSDPYEQLIEIVIPVSCWIDQRHRDHIQEFRFDVHWHRSVFPVVEYGPKTLMQSPVHGFIAVEKRDDQTVKVGGDSQIPAGAVKVGAKLETAKTVGQTERFEAIPQHDLLVASGSINRGTGVFFRFHSAKQFSLEGGRELSLVYRVPRSWRGGIIRIDCLAVGSVKRFPGITDELRSAVSFIVPTYLKGDREAQQVAAQYVQSEQSLRHDWVSYVSKKPEPKFWEQVQNSWNKDETKDELPTNWALQLIQSPSDFDLAEPTKKLPESLKTTVKHFADARRQMAGLSK
ncbi:MAG: hypothetical protein ABL888_02150 [Pirellulaceae bacterium]